MLIPTNPEIQARAVELGLIAQGEDLDSGTRAEVINQMITDANTPAAPEPGGQELVSRTVTAVNDGHLIVEVWFKSNPTAKENRA